MGSKDLPGHTSSLLSNRFKMTKQESDEWKTSLCFTGDNPMFPVEMFLRIVEEEAGTKGLDDSDKVLEVLSRIPDYNPRDQDGIAETNVQITSPASSWKLKLLDKQRKKQDENIAKGLEHSSKTGGLNWEELKSDMISEFGHKPNHLYTTNEKLALLQSLCKGRSESFSNFLVRVLTVVNLIENDTFTNCDLSEQNSQIPFDQSHSGFSTKPPKIESHNVSNSSSQGYHHQQTSSFAPTVSQSSLPSYAQPYHSIDDPSDSSSRQQYENWLTEQRRLGSDAETLHSYLPSQSRTMNQHNSERNEVTGTLLPSQRGTMNEHNNVHNINTYSMNSGHGSSNSHISTAKAVNPSNERSHSSTSLKNIGGQMDGQFDIPEDTSSQKSSIWMQSDSIGNIFSQLDGECDFQNDKKFRKESIWIRMLFLLGISSRERHHVFQLGNEIEKQGIHDICSYLADKKDQNIKQELPSSTDEYSSDEEEDDVIRDLESIRQNAKTVEDDHFNFQQNFELEMEVGHATPIIKVF